MSGIAGIIHFDGKPVDTGQVVAMTSAISHRGLDGINHWTNGTAALGQCMQRTTPESLEERQPVVNENASLVLVMDGWLSNWIELRHELLRRNVRLRNRSDAELVLRAYELWGQEYLDHVEGDFAIVVWDAHRRKAFCARDRMGHKPFYYHWNGLSLVFASEIHPVLAIPWIPEVPNEGMLAEFLAADWYAHDETLWKDIYRLVAAHTLVVTVKGLNTRRFWEPDLLVKPPYSSDEEYIEHYREVFLDNVRRCSRSNKNVAIQLSGGLDSTAVLCAAEHLHKSDRLLAPGTRAYTLAFKEGSAANELKYSRAVGEYLRIDIHEVPPADISTSWYTNQARAYRDFPGYPTLATFVDMFKETSLLGSRVMLTGIGGDEWLGGSRLYYADELYQRHWTSLYNCFKTDVSEYGFWQAWRWFFRKGIFQVLPLRLQAGVKMLLPGSGRDSTAEMVSWLSPQMQESIRMRRSRFRSRESRQVKLASQRLLLDSLNSAYKIYCTESIERVAAQAGIDIRHPMDDARIVQFVFSTPARLCLQGARTKFMHVSALRDLMPQLVLARKGKAEFTSVFLRDIAMMKHELTGIIALNRRDWVKPEEIEQLLEVSLQRRIPGIPLWILCGLYGCDTQFFDK